MTRALITGATWALLGLAGACGPDMTEPYEVKEPRLFAARVEVEGDPTRPRPQFGEKFAIRQFIALPKKPKTALQSRYSTAVSICLGLKLPDGTLACIPLSEDLPAEIPLTNLDIQSVSDDEIRLNGLEVPAFLASLPESFDRIDRLALFGAVCVDGKVERVEGKTIAEDPVSQLFRCTDNADAEFPDPLSFTLSVFVDRGRPSDSNTNPELACDADAGEASACNAGVPVDDEEPRAGNFVLVEPLPKGAAESTRRKALAWNEPSRPTAWDNCADEDAFQGPRVRAGSDDYRIRIRFDPQDREAFTYVTERNGEPYTEDSREELIVAHAATDLGGKLARYFSVLDKNEDDGEAEVEVDWTPPEQGKGKERIPESGRLVRFYFAVRDDRGGVDFTTRELCLVP